MNWKKLLVERLGNECRVCGQKDIERLKKSGVDAFLIGESLLRSENIGKKLKRLLGNDPH